MTFHRSCANNEYWASEEAYQKDMRRGLKAYCKEANPELLEERQWNPANKWRRGDVHPDSGLVFWAYNRRNTTTEQWLAPEDFAIRHSIAKKRALAHKRANIATAKQRLQRWQCKNRSRLNKARKHRYSTDTLFQLQLRLRGRTSTAFSKQGYTKKSKTFELIGCTQEDLFKHIEDQFTEGMSWDRFNEIEIDHIIPLSSAQTEEELIKLCHYTNLQPLWTEHNRIKGALMPEAFALLDLPPPPPPPDGLPVDLPHPTE